MRIAAIATLSLSALALAACSHPTPTPYSNAGWGFSATFQAPPKVTDTPAKAGAPHSVLVEANAAGDDFSVNVVDASSATGAVDDMLNATPNAVSQAMGLDVGAVTYTAVQGVTGRQVRFDRNDKPVMMMRIFFAGGNLYEISADSGKGVTDPAVKAFLDSFQLLNRPPAAASAPASNAPATNAPDDTNAPTNASV